MNWKRRLERSWGQLDMSLNDEIVYYLIFDTNVLFQTYEKKADFTSFNFNATYDNVIDMINRLDIYNRVILAIPSVVWNEMEKQIIDKHDELLLKYKNTITKRSFPEFSIHENLVTSYPEYIKEKIAAYKAGLSNYLNKIIELPIASNQCFDSIVYRAFNKLPPFEGKDKKSDKGFKDALLWESVLEFASNHLNSKIIFYSKDNIFGEALLKEFERSKVASSLSICRNEGAVKTQLEMWAKEIDKYSYQPIEDFDENKPISEWLKSGDFLIQIINRDLGLVEKGRLISSSTAHLISIDNIECLNIDEDSKKYYVEIVLQIKYDLKDGGETSETVNAGIYVEVYDDSVYSIEDAYRIDENEAESEINL